MIALDGSEWLPIAEAALRARVREDLIRQWKRRRRVAAHRIKGRVVVKVADVYHMEQRWRRRIGVSLADSSDICHTDAQADLSAMQAPSTLTR